MENASLEEPDSDLVKMWANLLVSSAEHYNTDNVYYVRLLSQMSSVQARLFEAMIGPQGPQSVLFGLEHRWFLGQHFIAEDIKMAFESAKKTPSTLNQAWKLLVKVLNLQGLIVEHIDVAHLQKDEYTSGCPPYSIYRDEQMNDYAILRGLGLIEYIDTGYIDMISKWNIKVMAHYVSPLGISFAEACGVQAGTQSKDTKKRIG